MSTGKKRNRTRRTGAPAAHHAHPSHEGVLPALRKIEGQIGGIQQMIADGRYCVDILTQCRAAMAALRNVEAKIFQTHLAHCVEQAFLTQDEDVVREKIDELTQLLMKRTSI